VAWYDVVGRPAARALALVPALPWYGWAAVAAAALAALFGGAGAAAAAVSSGPDVPQPPGDPPTLKKGSTGPWVAFLQSKLGLQPSATFDAATDTAVRAHQTAHGLTVDGVVGTDTWGTWGVKKAPSGIQPAPKPAPDTGDVTTVQPSPTPAPAPVTASNPFGLAEGLTARENQILAAVQAGQIDHEWVPVSWTKDGHTIEVQASRRALALREGPNRTIVSVSFATAQKIADMLGAVMLTTRVSDEIAKQAALKIQPIERAWYKDGSMAKTARMLEQSASIEQKVGDFAGLVANEGKDWVLTARWWNDPDFAKRHNAANFGWYRESATSTSPGGMKVVQSIGLTHGPTHVDYSQLGRFMKPTVWIDGDAFSVAEVLADPARAKLLHDEPGTIPQPRHPDL
jgi:peptidoglycan hydrolase-like protein with peptidoglycan-binding domain